MDWQDSASRMVDYRLQQGATGRLGPALKAALDEVKAANKERRTVGVKSQQAAEEATYAAYPEAAARRAGIDIGTTKGGVGAPEGMRETKRTIGGRTYEAPSVIDEESIAEMYVNTITKIRGYNSANSKYPNFTPLPIPTKVEFIKEVFPEFGEQKRGGQSGKIEVIRKSDGVRGTISSAAFDATRYTKV